MGPKIKLILFIAFITAAAAVPTLNEATGSTEQNFTELTYNMLKQKGNNIFSSFCFHTILTMSFIGTAGSTSEAYARYLAVTDKSGAENAYEKTIHELNTISGVILKISNKIYVDEGSRLKENFNNSMVNKFLSEVESINFADGVEAPGKINKWVQDKTDNKIKKMLPLNESYDINRLVLLSTIYFKGEWKNKFETSSIKTEPFNKIENGTVEAQMMNIRKKLNYKYNAELKVKIVELPLTSSNATLFVVLPDEKNGVTELGPKMEGMGLAKFVEGTQNTEVLLTLPKFRIEYDTDLKTPLRNMGIGEVFDSSKANFSNLMEGDEKLFVKKGVQKTWVVLNEEGVEAGAATVIEKVSNKNKNKRSIHAETDEIKTKTEALPQAEHVLANHPFMIIIRCGSTFLFGGRVFEPVSGDNSVWLQMV